jgi:hypothetical protein
MRFLFGTLVCFLSAFVKSFFVIPRRDIACFEETNFPLTLSFFEAAFFRFDYLPNFGEIGVGRYFLAQYFKTFYLRSFKESGK